MLALPFEAHVLCLPSSPLQQAQLASCRSRCGLHGALGWCVKCCWSCGCERWPLLCPCVRAAVIVAHQWATQLNQSLETSDPELFDIIEKEKHRQRTNLVLIASEVGA